MKKNYIILFLAILFSGITIAQETQKNFINYQGVARNGADQLMANETMTIGIALKMGSATAAAAYAENHSVTTDANGVFSLKIGNGDVVSGDYSGIPWGSGATFVSVLVNGSEIGTTEMMAVPYALSSGDGSQTASDVPYDNGVSGLVATNAQEAIDELVGSGAVDADADPSNEFQTLSFDVGTNELSLSDGNSVTIPGGGPGSTDNQNAMEVPYDNAISGLAATDTQAALDELAGGGLVDTDDQNLSLSGTLLQISDGTGVDLAPIIPPGGTDDQNAGEVPYDNAVSGLTAANAQDAIDELASGVIGGSSLWDQNGSSINYSAGNVGIGTATPQAPFDIAGQNNWDLNATEGDFRLGNDTYRLKMSTSLGGGGAGNARIRSQGGSNKLLLGSGSLDVLSIVDNNVGVGTIDPAAPLDVVGQNNWSPIDTEGDLRIGNASYRLKIGVALGGAGAGDSRINADGGTNRIILGGGTNDVLSVTDQFVGVGTIEPSVELDVEGSIRSSALSGTGNRNVVADGNGHLVIGAATGGVSQWSENLEGIHYNGGRVGIGTADPVSLQHLHSDSFESITRYTTSATGDGLGDGLAVRMVNNLDGLNAEIYNHEAGGSLRLGTNGLSRLNIAEDGNIGIGTSSPTAKLDVDGNIKSTDLSGTGQRNVMADADGNLVIGAGSGGSSLWTENGSNLHFNTGNVGIGNTSPGVEPGAVKYLTVATGTSPADNGFASIEIQGGQGSVNRPVGRLDFISNSAPGNSAIGRVESRTSGGAQFRGDLAFSTKNGPNYAASSLVERMTIKYDGDVGIGTINPTAKLDVNGDIKTSGEVHTNTTGMANMIPIAYGRVSSSGDIASGSGNFTVTRSPTGRYFIVIPGMTAEETRETTIVATRVNFLSPPGFISGGSGFTGGNPALIVLAHNMAGAAENIDFSFVAYKR